jgi:hypothetical protein
MRFRCPICGTILYLSLNCRRKCYFHGEFELNYETGKLEPLKKGDSDKELPFKRTFKDGDSWWRFQKVLDENSVKVEQMLRGNHGGGCPSPFKEKF